jgi:hypothetical protein
LPSSHVEDWQQMLPTQVRPKAQSPVTLQPVPAAFRKSTSIRGGDVAFSRELIFATCLSVPPSTSETKRRPKLGWPAYQFRKIWPMSQTLDIVGGLAAPVVAPPATDQNAEPLCCQDTEPDWGTAEGCDVVPLFGVVLPW